MNKDLGKYETAGVFAHFFILGNGRDTITVPLETVTAKGNYCVPIWDTRWSETSEQLEAYIYGHFYCKCIANNKEPHIGAVFQVDFESED